MKSLVICLLLYCSVITAHAQGNLARGGKHLTSASRPATYQTLKSSPRGISKLLHQRVARTYAQAQLTEDNLLYQSQLGILRSSQASVGISPRLTADLTKELYPGLEELLTTDKQLSDYFVARNNREVVKNSSSFVGHLQQQQAYTKLLQKHQHHYTHKASLDPFWLAEQIPADTDYVLLGEVHDVEEISQFIENFLPTLQEKVAPRPIIYLTEFLPEQMTFVQATEFEDLFELLDDNLISLWETATSFNIPVIGLEPTLVFFQTNEADLMRPGTILPFSRKHLQSLWSSDEGIRIRNESWKKQITEIRRKNPNALIVLHAGFGHLSHVRDYSIGNFLAQQSSVYTVSLAPGYRFDYVSALLEDVREYLPNFKLYPTPKQGFPPETFFDFATHGKFWQRIVQFEPQDRVITGFDIQIKVPAIPPEE